MCPFYLNKHYNFNLSWFYLQATQTLSFSTDDLLHMPLLCYVSFKHHWQHQYPISGYSRSFTYPQFQRLAQPMTQSNSSIPIFTMLIQFIQCSYCYLCLCFFCYPFSYITFASVQNTVGKHKVYIK